MILSILGAKYCAGWCCGAIVNEEISKEAYSKEGHKYLCPQVQSVKEVWNQER